MCIIFNGVVVIMAFQDLTVQIQNYSMHLCRACSGIFNGRGKRDKRVFVI